MTREYSKIKEKEPEVSLEIINGTRKITFEKDCLDEIEIYRKKNNKEWLSIAKNISSPFYDEDKIDAGNNIDYEVSIFTKEGDIKTELFSK